MPTWLFVAIWVLWSLGVIRVLIVSSRYSSEQLKNTGFPKEVRTGLALTVIWFSYLIFG